MKNFIEHPRVGPTMRSHVVRVPWAKSFWQCPPFAAIAGHEGQGVQKAKVTHTRTASGLGQEMANAFELVTADVHCKSIVHHANQVQLLCEHTLGEGEWKCKKHGAEYRRQWRKLHIGIDADTLQIRAICVTSNNVGDASVLSDLLAQLPPDETSRA